MLGNGGFTKVLKEWKFQVTVILLLAISDISSTGSCSETQNANGGKSLEAPCYFTQLAADKRWNTGNLEEKTSSYFRFPTLQCSSYEENSGKIQLSCIHADSFYLMKEVLSYGTAVGTKITFNLNPTEENTYNGTEITIEGRLAQSHGSKAIKATKSEGSTDFTFVTDPFPELNMEDFMNQRQEGGFNKLSLDATLGSLPPKTVSNAIMSGIFSAESPQDSSPNSQNYELVITFGGERAKKFFIIQRVITDITFNIAFYNVNQEGWSHPSMFMGKVGAKMRIPESFSPVLEADTSAVGSSTGQIVIVNSKKVRDIAEKFVSQSSQALLLKGAFLYWHVEDTNSIKVLAKDVTGVVDPPAEAKLRSKAHQQRTKSKQKANKKKVVKEKSQNKRRERREVSHIAYNDYLNQVKGVKAMIRSSGDEADFTERDSKLAFNAHFTRDTNIVTIKSPEYLKGTLSKILRTFMPNTVLRSEASKLAAINVVFSKAEIHVAERKYIIHCNITQDFDFVTNLLTGDGFTITAEVAIPQPGAPVTNTQWKIRGSGRTEMLQQLIEVNIIEKANGHYYVTGSFEIANMTQLWKATGEVHYLSEQLRQAYPRLTEYSVEDLKLDAKIGDDTLRIYGKSLVFAESKSAELVVSEKRSGVDVVSDDLVDKADIEILMKKDTTISYTVGLSAKDFNFEHVMKSLFDKNIDGYPWLKIKQLGLLFSNEASVESLFKDASLQLLANELTKPGIFMIASLEVPEEGECKARKSAVAYETSPNDVNFVPSTNHGTEMVDKTCVFIKENPILADNLGSLKGEISTGLLTLQTQAKNNEQSQWFRLFPNTANTLAMHFPVLYIVEKVVDNSEEELQVSIKGSFRLTLNEMISNLLFHGEISFDETRGQLKLNLELTGAAEYLNLPFKVFKMTSSYSVLTNEEFSRYYTRVLLNIGTVDGKRVSFNRETSMKFYSTNNDAFYVQAQRDNFERNPAKKVNTFLDIFEAFGITSAHTHVFLKDVQAMKVSTMVYNLADDEEFTIRPHEYKFKKGLNIYGTASILGKSGNKFYMSYNMQTSTMKAELNLPRFELPLSRSRRRKPIILKGNKGKRNGGKLAIIATAQSISVTFVGFIETIGVSKKIEIPVDGDGKFAIDFTQLEGGGPFRLYNEAKCTMSIRQEEAVSTLYELNPRMEIDLSPSSEQLVTAVKSRVTEIAEELTRIRTGDSFNRFTSAADGDARDVRTLMDNINEQMGPIIDKIEANNRLMSQDCIQKCESKKLSVYGYRFEAQFKGDEQAHEVSNVLCISTCEITKPKHSRDNQNLFAKIKESKTLFSMLMLRKEIMQKTLDNFYSYLYKLNKRFKHTGKIAAKQLNFIDQMYEEQNQQVAFSLFNLKLDLKVTQIMTKELDTKCVRGFHTNFQLYNDERKRIAMKICFNGEFQQYYANTAVRRNFDEEKWRSFNMRMQAAGDREKVLRLETDRALGILKRAANPQADELMLGELLKDLDTYKLSDDEVDHEDEDTNTRSYINQTAIKKTRMSSVLYFGSNQSISFPILDHHLNKLSSMKRAYLIKRPEAKRVFMYSSPWVAVKFLSLYKNETFNPEASKDVHETASYCQLSKRYLSVARSLSDCISSYKHANKKHLAMSLFLNKGRAKLAAVYNSSVAHFSSAGKKDAMFWLREYNRGSEMYSQLSNSKLVDFNVHGMNRWKENAARTLSDKFKGSVTTVEGYLHALHNNTIKAILRSNVPVNGQNQLDNLSQELNGLLTSDSTLHQLSTNPIKDHVIAFAGAITKQCQ